MCGGPLLVSHGKKRCPSREHEPYTEEINDVDRDWVEEVDEGDDPTRS